MYKHLKFKEVWITQNYTRKYMLTWFFTCVCCLSYTDMLCSMRTWLCVISWSFPPFPVETLIHDITASSQDSLELQMFNNFEQELLFLQLRSLIQKWSLSTQIQEHLLASVLTMCRPVSLGRSDDPHLSHRLPDRDPALVFLKGNCGRGRRQVSSSTPATPLSVWYDHRTSVWPTRESGCYLKAACKPVRSSFYL